jgi:putative ABC transport system permease protein
LYSRLIPGSETFRTATNAIEPRELAARYPEVKNFCYLDQSADNDVNIKDSTGNEYHGITVTHTSTGFIDIFTPEILFGDVKQAFTPGKTMLTASIARKIFGNADPLGKVLYYWNQPVTVTAICADFPENCSMKNGVYFYQHETHRNNWGYTTYLKINPKDREKLLKTLNEDKYLQRESNMDKNWRFELTALPDVYLRFPAKGEGNLTTIVSLLAIGILLLIISYINFLNFSIAMAPVRIKSFNIRRIFGESPAVLKISIIMESIFLSLIAFFVSILIINFLNTGAVKYFFRADLAIFHNLKLMITVGVISLLTGFLAGIYPAFYVTSFKPAMALSGSFLISGRTRWLKNILIGTQFVAAIFLIIVTLFIKIQYDYMQNKNWGIHTENILYINTERIRNNVENLTAELKKNPNIVDLTGASVFPGKTSMRTTGTMFEETNISVSTWFVEPNFLDFFGINVINGRKFEENDEYDDYKVIFNQAFLKKYGFNNDIIGKTLEGNEIIGIAEDFNFKSLQEYINPLAIYSITKKDINYKNHYNYAFVKTMGVNTSQTIDFIRDTWKKFSNEPVDVLFLDKTLADLYKKENNLAKLVSTCGAIAIIVAIMGLYGLILFNAKSKRKNIAIRKINGATKHEIVMMLNHDLLIQFVIAYVISVPIAGYVVNRWLEGFAYKTPMYWWVFILGGLIVLIISLITVSWESYKAASANPIEGIKTE